MKATLGDAKTQIDVSTLGVPACSAAFTQLLNEATQRLLMGPDRWWDVHHKLAINVTNGCVTWPRDVANIESIALCGVPMTIRNEWFEFLESGYGVRCCDAQCENQMFDRGSAVTFKDIRHGYTIKLVTQKAEEEGLEMGFLGYDCQGNWIRTQDASGTYRDGVWVPIPISPNAPYTGQVQFALAGITGIIKPKTNGYINLYDYNLISGDSQKIGVYEWDETRPSYRRCLIGGIPDDCTKTVTVMYRQEYKPVENDNDFLLIANIPALSSMMQAVKLYRQNQMQLASGHEAKAYQILDREVAHYIGNGTVEPLRIDYRNFGAGSIPVLY